MAIINTGLLTKGLRSEFFNRFNATTTFFSELATRIQSNSDSETYRWLGLLPRMREWGSGRVAKGLGIESYSVDNLKYESPADTCAVTLASGAGTVASKTFNATITFPAANTSIDLGAVSNAHVSAGDVMTLAVTNGTTADPGPFVVEVDFV